MLLVCDALTRLAWAQELRKLARSAWPHWPEVVIYLTDRFKLPPLADEVAKLVRSDPVAVQDCADALAHFVGESLSQETRSKIRVRAAAPVNPIFWLIRRALQHLLYWKPVPVPEALRFLFPKFGGDPVLLQYALRVLEHHPVEVTFFYVPQVVQALRSDELGYAERFIFETCATITGTLGLPLTTSPAARRSRSSSAIRSFGI